MSNETEHSKDSEQGVTEFDLTTDPTIGSGFPAWIKWLTILCFLGLLILAGAVYYLLTLGQKEIAALKTDIQSQIQTDMNTGLESVKEIQRQLDDKITDQGQQQAAIEELQSSQAAIEETITALNQQRPDSNLDWTLAEIENLVVIALQRLQLANDIPTAITALESADLRLKDLSDPNLLAVRQQLTNDINNLKSVNQVDSSGMSLYLSDLIAKVDTLPLKDNVVNTSTRLPVSDEVESTNNKTWQDKLFSLPGLIWQEVKSNLVIKHNDELEGSSAFLLPEQEYYLYQNLRLQLQNAKFAVLTQDTASLQVSVETIIAWLQKHFKSNDSAVNNVIEALSKMKTVELNPELPDISSSLETLRAAIRNNQSNNN